MVVPVEEPDSSDCQISQPQQQRLNKNLLSLGKLRNSTRSNASISTNGTIEISPDKGEEALPPPPPPSYDSVVRIQIKADTISLPSTSQLPKYRDVAGLADAPPTYHSLFSDKMLRAINPFADDNDVAADSCDAIVQARCKFASVCFNFLLFVFLVTFVLILPIGMIAIGITFVHSCPVQPRIPIYLIVLGIFQMLECCGRLGYKIFQNGQERNGWRERYRRKDPLVYFVIVWFVIGSMWVYQTDPRCKDCTEKHTYTPVFNTTMGNYSTSYPVTTRNTVTGKVEPVATPTHYCDMIIYNFAFWIITTYYSVIGFFCLMLIIDVLLRTINRCCCSQRN